MFNMIVWLFLLHVQLQIFHAFIVEILYKLINLFSGKKHMKYLPLDVYKIYTVSWSGLWIKGEFEMGPTLSIGSTHLWTPVRIVASSHYR